MCGNQYNCLRDIEKLCISHVNMHWLGSRFSWLLIPCLSLIYPPDFSESLCSTCVTLESLSFSSTQLGNSQPVVDSLWCRLVGNVFTLPYQLLLKTSFISDSMQ